MCNYFKIPLILICADGDSRFRRQMQTISGYWPKTQTASSKRHSLLSSQKIVNGAKQHYIYEASEMVKNPVSAPSKPFSENQHTNISFYLGIRCLSDVFCMSAPFISRLPRCTTQDPNASDPQSH